MLIEPWHIWVILGLVLWIIEMFTSGFVIAVFGTACVVVALVAGAGATFELQLLAFGIVTAVLALGIRPLVLTYFCSREREVRTNLDALRGKIGIVTEPIDGTSMTGRVRIDGEEWRAVVCDGSIVKVGRHVIVREIDGCTIVVEAGTTLEGGGE